MLGCDQQLDEPHTVQYFSLSLFQLNQFLAQDLAQKWNITYRNAVNTLTQPLPGYALWIWSYAGPPGKVKKRWGYVITGEV